MRVVQYSFSSGTAILREKKFSCGKLAKTCVRACLELVLMLGGCCCWVLAGFCCLLAAGFGLLACGCWSGSLIWKFDNTKSCVTSCVNLRGICVSDLRSRFSSCKTRAGFSARSAALLPLGRFLDILNCRLEPVLLNATVHLDSSHKTYCLKT